MASEGEDAIYAVSADLYDRIYSFKDYAGEAAILRDLIRARPPGARRLLNVACGTDEHGRFLAQGFSVDGVDIEPRFLAQARVKNPAGRYVETDMRRFEMGVRYDAVLCLFSSIGYLLTQDDLEAAIARMAAHVDPGGLVIVEPWWTPEKYAAGTIGATDVDDEVGRIRRLNTCKLEDGNIALMELHYLIGEPGGDIRHGLEIHRLRCSTVEEMTRAFQAAGLTLESDAPAISRRGLYVGCKPG